MIDFHYELDFKLANETHYTEWLYKVLKSENYSVEQINYIFCDDEYLLKINIKHLKHNTLTDIITFDYTKGKAVVADVFISIERVKENAGNFNVAFKNELLRVMAHGILHVMGYKDKSEKDTTEMRLKEEEKIKMFHVEQ